MSGGGTRVSGSERPVGHIWESAEDDVSAPLA